MKKVMSTFMVALVSGLTMLAADSPKYGLLKGRILDNEKNPLAGAVVVIDSDKLSAVTDLDGFFSFANLSSGNHSLKVTYIGFLPVSKTITVSEESTIDDIVMSDTSRELNEVVVTGVFSGQQRAINAQKNNVNITNVVSADQIGKFPDSNIGDALKRISGINVQYLSTQFSYHNVIHI